MTPLAVDGAEEGVGINRGAAVGVELEMEVGTAAGVAGIPYVTYDLSLFYVRTVS